MSAETDREEESGVATEKKIKLQKPRMYKVIMHNDDYTTMDFVIHVLEKYFQKAAPEAHAIMLEVHTKGKGVCGVFTYEIAETKVAQVTTYARDNQHPLMCTLEEA